MQESISYFRTALACRPAFPEAEVKLALVLETQNLPGEALDLLNQAIKEDPKYPEAHYRLALLLAKTGRQEEADRQFALFRQYRADSGK
jgi:tetratricopeptide (TPR) repeat protein